MSTLTSSRIRSLTWLDMKHKLCGLSSGSIGKGKIRIRLWERDVDIEDELPGTNWKKNSLFTAWNEAYKAATKKKKIVGGVTLLPFNKIRYQSMSIRWCCGSRQMS